MDFKNYIPNQAFPQIKKWITELNIDIRFVNPRKTKLGDYQFRNNQHFITVNNNLNKYAALITLTHEIAHAFTFVEFGKTIKPHAIQWKENFKKLMLTFFDDNIFALRKGDEVGERLAKISADQNILLMVCDQCAVRRNMATGTFEQCGTGEVKAKGFVDGVVAGCFPQLYTALGGNPPDQVISL